MVGSIGALWVVAGSGDAAGGEIAPEYQAKAVLILNLALFTEWPDKALPPNKKEFVVGILGKNPFGKNLNDVFKGQSIKKLPIVIREFANVDQVKDCQMLFISSSEKNNMAEIVKRLQGRSILTVSDTKGFIQNDGIFNIVLKPANDFGHLDVEWEINGDAARKERLQINKTFYRKAIN